MANTSTYYDKTFRRPEYIWNSGKCNIDLLSSTIEQQHVHRLAWLARAGSVRMEVPAPTTTSSQPPLTVDNAVKPQEKSDPNAAPPSPGASRNVVVPLLSLVWNGAEPQNYVRSSSSNNSNPDDY
jgi:hypothetical protein